MLSTVSVLSSSFYCFHLFTDHCCFIIYTGTEKVLCSYAVSHPVSVFFPCVGDAYLFVGKTSSLITLDNLLEKARIAASVNGVLRFYLFISARSSPFVNGSELSLIPVANEVKSGLKLRSSLLSFHCYLIIRRSHCSVLLELDLEGVVESLFLVTVQLKISVLLHRSQQI